MPIDISTRPTEQQLKRWIRSVETEAMSDMNDFWNSKAVPIVAAEVGRVFVTQGFASWQALSPLYAARKEKVRPMATILRLTDKYFRAATRVGDSGNFVETGKTDMRYGINLSAFEVPYPLFHEEGTSKMPARPVWSTLAESPALSNKLVVAFQAWMAEKVDEQSKKIFKR